MKQKTIKELEQEQSKLISQVNELERKNNRKKQKEKQQQRNKNSEEYRQRTRRLIRKGAMLEKYLDIEQLSVDETEIYLKKLSNKIKKS